MSDRFEFGQNWSSFIKKRFREGKLEKSRKHLLDLLQNDSMEGKAFLGIGCGSGLHLFADLLSSAKSVRGFDYDENTVAAGRYLHTPSLYSYPENGPSEGERTAWHTLYM